MISPDRLTVKSAEALNEALAEARRAGNPQVYDTHLLLVLLAQEESIVVPVLQKLGASVAALRENLAKESARYAKQTDAQPTMARELTSVLDQAEREAKSLGDEYVSTEHLLLALTETKGTETRALLNAAGVTHKGLLGAIEAVRGSHPRHRPDAGKPVSGAPALHARPHRGRAKGQARSRDRPR
jgi:ATP-dependent Clp protease ATP-binding subunit ClpB